MFPRTLYMQFVVTVVLIAVASGCGGEAGPKRYAVQGTVRLDGKPLRAGTIRFIPRAPTKGPATVAPIADGAYSIPSHGGAVAGSHRVEIESRVDLPFEIDDERAYAQMYAQSKTLRRQKLPQQPVPAEYNHQSRLTATVTGDSDNTFDFDLKLASRANTR